MDTRQLLQNAIDYIDAHIKSQITPEDLSRVAGYSYVHLVRLFKLYLGVTPKAYLLRRRLLFAVYEMKSKKPKTDIAFDFGFDTYAGFTKRFNANSVVLRQHSQKPISAASPIGSTFCRRTILWCQKPRFKRYCPIGSCKTAP